MPRGKPISRDQLHLTIFNKSNNSAGKEQVKFAMSQAALAKELQVSPQALNEAFRDLERAGKIKKIGRDRTNIATYLIHRPLVLAE